MTWPIRQVLSDLRSCSRNGLLDHRQHLLPPSEVAERAVLYFETDAWDEMELLVRGQQ
jgi:hypothetical protein